MNETTKSANQASFFKRFWQYQNERFPFFKHGLLIAVFSASSICVSALLRGQTFFPGLLTFLVCFMVLFLFFLQLRILDEFKDAEKDALYRPERPVPRGLIHLKELAVLGLFSILIQMSLVLFFYWPLLFILALTWCYMGLMTVEFFVPKWLNAHLFLYMITHMMIMPLIDLFATAVDWLPKMDKPPLALIWFLIVSFLNGIIIEIGRKCWAPSMEKQGVESYSSAWGIKKSLSVWFAAIFISFICAIILALKINFFFPTLIILGILSVGMIGGGLPLFYSPQIKYAKRIENLSAIWVLVIYLVLGLIPMVLAK